MREGCKNPSIRTSSCSKSYKACSKIGFVLEKLNLMDTIIRWNQENLEIALDNYTENGGKVGIYRGGCANFSSGASDYYTSTRRELAVLRKVNSLKQLQARPKPPGKTNGTPRRWNEHLGKTKGVCSLNRSGTCPYL